MSTVHYSERQYFRQDWLWALLLVGSVPAAVLASVAVAVDADPETNVPLVIGVILLLVFAPLALFYRANLRVEVRDDALHLRLWPLHLRPRTIDCANIESIRTDEISPMGEFGGVGIRLNPSVYRWGCRLRRPRRLRRHWWPGRPYRTSGRSGNRDHVYRSARVCERPRTRLSVSQECGGRGG